ncbi:hypothetical protein A3C96_01540 [Candidatus Uhrbacteria bacterium RIFCSPHIGHO2_02_FULL_60_10]|uniref:Uncharacterized protein n=1 Tax=Candidatus Uhrbacteria bacterium RIFCSPHIGHO2_02_FULL_60_10 TaxID=1802392 RepID=A0A1F7U4G3_9BACT|nr:MAG: hypothetical protein A3C96_01540 [Candidatus Uhrbacteria bacterium RIFCSPHIGHO2_02_FULL_60_10]
MRPKHGIGLGGELASLGFEEIGMLLELPDGIVKVIVTGGTGAQYFLFRLFQQQVSFGAAVGHQQIDDFAG